MSSSAEPTIRRHILLVEDNPADVRLTIEALRDAGYREGLTSVGDGATAIAFLRRQGDYRDSPRPDLVLLDLNLPGTDGRAVLAVVKADPALLSIPVLVISTSRADSDLRAAYNLHANCYLNKPMDLDEFWKMMAQIVIFWLRTVTLPPEG